MIEKIKHYAITNVHPTVHDEEAMTVLELVGRTAGKMNELIEDVEKRFVDQNNTISQRLEEIPEEIERELDTQVESEITNAIRSGMYDDVIGEVTERVVDLELLPYGRFIASNGLNYEIKADELVKGEQYSNANGQVVTGATAYRSKYIYPCREGVFFTFDGIVNGDMQPYNYIACYDHNMKFIGFSRLSATVFTGNLPVNATPTGTCFVGFTFIVKEATTTLAGVKLHHIDNGELSSIYHPFEHNNVHYAYYKKHWCDGLDNTLKSVENFDCVVFNVKGLKAITSTETNVYNAIFIDGDNAIISKGETYEALTRGRLYEVPDNAVLCVMNFSNKTTVQWDEQPNEVVGLVRENGKGLNGKRVVCIGDSITWLDGQQGFDNTNAFKGWQDELRKRGAIVSTVAFSGSPVSNYYDETTDAEVDGIGTKIQSGEYDGIINPCDIGVIFVGSNDARLHSPIMELYSYDGYSYDGWGVEDGLACIVQKLNSTSPKKIFVCSLIPSANDTVHTYDSDEPYNVAIEKMSRVLSTTFIDLWNVMPKPDVNFSCWYYDDTHPNHKGMAQIGRVIARDIERVIE